MGFCLKMPLDRPFILLNNGLMSEKYISLREATRYCPYSQDYLKLRARQGKLRAVKMGRNWFTTIEWLEIYKKNSKLTSGKTASGSRSPIKRLILFFLLICLIFIVFFILIVFLEPVLEKIIPAKVIEI